MNWETNIVTMFQEAMDEDQTPETAHQYLFGALQRFQTRNLTHDGDTLNAMTGILQRVGAIAHTQVIEGMQQDIFPVALSFVLSESLPGYAAALLKHQPVYRKTMFPSWSWAGWKAWPAWIAWNDLTWWDRESFSRCIEGAFADTLVTFHKYDETSTDGSAAHVIWAPRSEALRSACFKAGLPLPSQLDATNKASRSLGDARPYQMLIVTAVTIVLSANMHEDDPEASEHAKGRLRILADAHGHQCGDLRLDMRMPLVEGTKLTFLVLSMRRTTRTGGYALKALVPALEADDTEFLWVMLVVEMEESGLHERRGMGRVLKDCVSHAFDGGPRWREIVLG